MPTELLRNWAAGVITQMAADELPTEASPRARNSALYHIFSGYASAGKRRGARLCNTTPVTDAPAIIGQYAFKRRSGTTLAQHHLLVSDAGRLDVLASDGTVAPADSGDATPFTAGSHIPAFASANNLAFVVNGQEGKKFDGTAVSRFGIARPAAAPTTVAGSAGSPDGDYEFAVTYGNTVTGQESSRSPASAVTVSSDAITVSLVASADPQVDIIYLYVRKASLNNEFWRLVVGTTPATNDAGGFANTTADITVDVTDTQLNALILLAPSESENDPPPAGVFDLAWHRNRMFACDAVNLYYSQTGKPESFDPANYEAVNADDGQLIVGITVAFDQVVIFKTNSIYVLDGYTPEDWVIRQVEPSIGAVSKRSIAFANGYLWWWSEERGPMRWTGSGAPDAIGEMLIGPTIGPEALDYTALGKIITAVDMPRQRLVFAVPRNDGGTRNNLLLPYSYRVNGWESDGWELIDVASMGVADDSSGQPWIYLGGYHGQVSELWSADVDAVRSHDSGAAAFTLTGTPTSMTSNTLTDTGATFDTTGGGLVEAYVVMVDAEGNWERRRITANTATELTFTPDITIAPTTYYIGSANFELDTKWFDTGEPFRRKHLQFLFTHATSSTGAADITIQLYTDWDLITPVKTLTVSAAGGGDVWDTAVWDVARFASEGTVAETRRRLAQVAKVYRLRFINREPNTACIVLKAAIESTLQGSKR